VIASGLLGLTPGRESTERDVGDLTSLAGGRRATEQWLISLASRGVRSTAVRLSPTVHGEGDHGFVPRLIAIARAKAISGYVGDGSSRWSAVHRLDAANLFRLALENAPAGTRVHAAAEEGVPVRAIAEAIGRNLQLPVVSLSPEEAAQHFGFLGPLLSLDGPASSAQTRAMLGWEPKQPGLIEDLDQGHYFVSPAMAQVG
jgi:nucleoside-diphosphate-sugar epimerase